MRAHDLYGKARRLGGQTVAELSLLQKITRAKKGRRALFFPTNGRNGMSCELRAFDIADALNVQGWQAVTVPGKLSAKQRRRILARFKPDIVVLQKSRHPLNRPENFQDVPFVLDVDDADFLDPALSDLMEETARRSAGVICGSRFVRDWAQRHNDNTAIIWTGSEPSANRRPPHAQRRPIVAWAISSAMRYPHEFSLVVDVICRLAVSSSIPFVYRQYGWDGPDDHPQIRRVRDAGVEVELVRGLLPYSDFIESLNEIAVGLAPLAVASEFSRGKSFGKILGYLDAKVPVLCSDTADHAAFFRPGTGVVSNDPEVWVNTAIQWLSDASQRDAVAGAAYADYLRRLSTDASARQTDRFLSRTIERADSLMSEEVPYG